ncbi:SpoIIE family protein phosphatase [Streptomyces sp. NPDC051207]|uniref:ATP-binding SpoIIE family protein phosphatase n=1 Tax=Streptomyces sp. NPDC051207 TaxID=3154641 RepID=UPI0034193951
MTPTTHAHGIDGPPDDRAAVFGLDGDGVVMWCTDAVRALVGRPPGELRGRRITDLVTEPDAWAGALGASGQEYRTLRTSLIHQDGSTVEADAAVLPLPASGQTRFVVRVAPGSEAAAGSRAEDESVIRALFGQHHIGLLILGTDLRITRGNAGPRRFGVGCHPDGVCPPGLRLTDLLVRDDAEAIEEQLRRVLDTGEALIDWKHSARPLTASGQERVLSLSAFRLHDAGDGATGVAAVFTDITEEYTARRRLALLHAAATRLGRTLDVTHNAQELAAVLVPFADLVSVDLSDTVFLGREPSRFLPGTRLRRIATASASGTWPEDIHQVGDTVRAREEESEALVEGQTVLVPDMAAFAAELNVDEERRRLLFPEAATSALFVPLHARGSVLGVLGLWRTGDRTPFTGSDVPLIEEIASRAALSLENARRYTTELRTVETLQRSLLPPSGVALSAAESAGIYVPAGSASGIGGCWYDVIELSAARVGFVIGDVAGHGLAATAAMGRLRTAVQTLSDLDLPPEELLTHLDDLVVRLSSTEPQSPDGGVLGSTCLYCVYDPVTGRCVMAGAGHPPPVLITPDGRSGRVNLTPGPPLGTGTLPFEPLELTLAPDSVLVFHTKGLGSDDDRMALLERSMATAAASGASPAGIGRAGLDQVLTGPPADEVAVLVAGVRRLPEGTTAAWQLAADPSVVAEARRLITAQLAAWGLEELTFTSELIVSELITNAIRYAEPPVGLRLIKDKSLICEVSDASQTQPRLRRARLMDEGGRGLFLIAQLAHRWGSRYTASGKTIWTEQQLTLRP